MAQIRRPPIRKLPRPRRRRKKRVAGDERPIVVVPVVVDVVVVEPALVIVAVEHEHGRVFILIEATGTAKLYRMPSVTPPVEYSWG